MADLGKPQRSLKTEWPMLSFGALAVVYLAVAMAPQMTEGLISGFFNLDKVQWFPLKLVPWTFTVVGIFLFIYAFACLIYLTALKNKKDRRSTKGDAQWGDIKTINKKINDVAPWKDEKGYYHYPSKILTQNVGISYEVYKHKHNLNTLILGTLGTGKTRGVVKPNLLQGNTSFVVLDPKGEIVRDTGSAMEALGYKVKVLDLRTMERSHRYNPFVYLTCDKDVISMCTNLFKATNDGQKSGTSEPFWDNAAMNLLLALAFYLYKHAPDHEKNFAMIVEMIRNGAVDEQNPNDNPLDKLFSELPDEELAKNYYDLYNCGAAKTLQSIQSTLNARLGKFVLPELQELTKFDMLDLGSLGEERTVLYAVIPDDDDSFNFMVSILYTQLFQILYYRADFVHNGPLPVPVHFVMDEFYNVALPDNFLHVLTTMRSRGISVSIIIQSLAQLKSKYEKDYITIEDSCDIFLFLGGNSMDGFKEISERLGAETIDIDNSSQSKGSHGSYSISSQQDRRNLMDPDEVGRLDNGHAILFIRGERPIYDAKYEIKTHPNVDLSADGKYGSALNYNHGLVIDNFDDAECDKVSVPESTSDEVIEIWTAQELNNRYLEVSQ